MIYRIQLYIECLDPKSTGKNNDLAIIHYSRCGHMKTIPPIVSLGLGAWQHYSRIWDIPAHLRICPSHGILGQWFELAARSSRIGRSIGVNMLRLFPQ